MGREGKVGKGTFSRGRWVLIAGKERRTPVGVEVMGQVLRSWFSSACAPSRAVAARSFSRFPVDWSGFGSFARRRPKSNVYGVGFVTVTGSFERSFESAIVNCLSLQNYSAVL